MRLPPETPRGYSIPTKVAFRIAALTNPGLEDFGQASNALYYLDRSQKTIFLFLPVTHFALKSVLARVSLNEPKWRENIVT